MELAVPDAIISAVNFALTAVLTGIFGVWLYFMAYMAKSFRTAPRIEVHCGQIKGVKKPKVSVILPARNEEKFIGLCLDTLLAQDYPNFEVIAIDDDSTDMTGEIIQSYATKDRRIVYVSTPRKPDGWAGKNWACHQGYKKASGEFLFFTDADTKHAPNIISLAIGHMLAETLEALTAIPHLLCNDFWTKITLPVLSTFLYTRFSPLRVNDPKKKTGYFFGSFFVITRKTYEAVGTHEGVRHELVEDGALGSKVKAGGYRMKMVRGEKHVEAIWARDLPTLWHGLRRLVIPLYHQDPTGAHLMATAVFFIVVAPFVFLTYTIPGFLVFESAGGLAGLSSTVLLALQIITILLLVASTSVQSKLGVIQSPLYAFGSPLSGVLIYLAFASAIVDASKKDAVRWRGRKYTISEKQNFLH